MLIILGLSAANSNYACIWCHIPKEKWYLFKTKFEQPASTYLYVYTQVGYFRQMIRVQINNIVEDLCSVTTKQACKRAIRITA